MWHLLHLLPPYQRGPPLCHHHQEEHYLDNVQQFPNINVKILHHGNSRRNHANINNA